MCCTENKIAVMRKLEARVKMLNNADLWYRHKRKTLKKNVSGPGGEEY